MGQPNALQIIGIGAARDARNWLYRTDYPRRIDRYIDFFGTGAPLRETADRHGGLVLEFRA